MVRARGEQLAIGAVGAVNLFESAPEWLVWLLAALLVAAAVEDAVRLKISNILCLGVLAGAIAAMGFSGPDISLWQNALVFTVLLAGGTFLFSLGKMGGGDVKLMATLGLWCDIPSSLNLLLGVFLSGGVLALLILGARMFAPAAAGRRVVVLRPGSGIPYGVAIAAGGLIALALHRGG